jgi:hypothetical protein
MVVAAALYTHTIYIQHAYIIHTLHILGGGLEVVVAALLAQLDARLVPVLAVLAPAPDVRHLRRLER